MSVSIKKIRSATPAEWDNVWQECDYSTYFHSKEWAEIWNIYTKGKMRPDPKLVIFTDGKKALLPLSYQRRVGGLVKNYVSSPAGTFGGWISTDGLTIEHGRLLANYLTEKLGNLFWRFNPYDELVFKLGLEITEDDETHALNLSEGFDAVYKRASRTVRQATRKAHSEGVLIRRADNLEDWQTYFRVYEDSLIRWGEDTTSRYGWELFKAMFRRNSFHIRLWVAIYEGKLVAGDICFYAKRHVVAWHAAALEKFFHLRPVNLLRYEVIKNACEQGYSWYDLNPSGGHEGVKQFKKRLGAVPLSCHVIFKEKKSSELMCRMAQKLKNYSKLTAHRLNHRLNRNTEAADNLEPKNVFCDGQYKDIRDNTEEVKGALK